MNKAILHLLLFLTLLISAVWNSLVNAAELNLNQANTIAIANPAKAKQPNMPFVVPAPPNLDAKSYVLIDANSGEILAQKNMHQRLPPASLTKLMTLYITFKALASGQVQLNDKVLISKTAWHTGGSRMFLNPGKSVPLAKLIQGIIVDSGNDATVAVAEYIAGSQKAFVPLMNQQAQLLGMKNSHFSDVNGLPIKDHYSTAHDLAILTRAIIKNYPQYYHFFNEKYLTYDHIKQPNRNRLLWEDASVDGLKTGHTKEAGYCLITSAQRKGMRIISVLMGAPTDRDRATFSERLLNYGFRFYQTYELYKGNTPITQARAWYGANKEIHIGLQNNLFITIPKGEYKHLKAQVSFNHELNAPIRQGMTVGELKITLNNKLIKQQPLIALETDQEGGLWTKMRDATTKLIDEVF
ncbi:MAG: D-alanyl-D-alanine carboxypeptidase family protein [Pseudomonadota bacterium]